MEKTEQLADVYRLSPMQEGMLFHALRDKGSHAYFEQTVFTLRGNIDKQVLEESFNRLIGQYDILRTVFHFENLKLPLQIVLKERRLKVAYRDISHLEDRKKAARLKALCREDRERGFDLSRDLLTRISLFKTGPGAYKLLWSCHHIVMDGWCLGIVFKDLLRFYRSSLRGGPPEDPGPVTPYRVYIDWLERRDREGALHYWRGYLEGYDRPARLPGDRNRPGPGAGGDYRKREYSFVLGASLTEALTGTARKNRVSLTAVFQSLWGLLLQGYNNTGDVVFGIVVSGRPPEIRGIERMVGLFINTVPLRVKSGTSHTFSSLLGGLHRRAAESKAWEYESLADIQAGCPVKDRLITHVLIFQNYPFEEELKDAGAAYGTGFSVEEVESFEQTNYDFTCTVTAGESVKITFDYNGFLYTDKFMRRLAGHFEYLARQVAQNPRAAVGDLEIITPAEKQLLLDLCNNDTGSVPPPESVLRLFEARAERTLHRIALIDTMSALSYRVLNKKSNQLAHRLRQRGVGPGTVVAIEMARSIEMITGILGILKAGAAYLPIDPGYPRERIDYILKDSKTRILFRGINEIIDTSAKDVGNRLACSSTSTAPRAPGLAYIIYTSGSTGRPKGVMVEHRNLSAYINAFQKEFRLRRGDTVLQQASAAFDTFVEETWPILLKGGTLAIATGEEVRDIDLLVTFIVRHRVTVISVSPHLLRMLNRRFSPGRNPVPAVRFFISGGDVLSPGDIDNLPPGRVYNTYGPTETTVCATYYRCKKGDDAIPIGKPVRGTGIFILDRNLKPLPVGITGELCIAGAGVTRGYLNRPELTAERFYRSYKTYKSYRTYSFYRTGDLAQWLPSGNITFSGREDGQVKIRGYRIELAEIESCLSAHDRVRGAVVTLRKDNAGDNELCAYIVGEITGLRECLSRRLPAYMVPSRFVSLEKFPLTPTGKVCFDALPDPVNGPSQGCIAPIDAVEETLVTIWADVLGVEKETVGTADDFFALGGHSLKTTIVAGRIHKELEIKVPVAILFQYPRIRELARYLRGAARNKYAAIRPTEKKEYYPISLSQQRFYMLQQMNPESTAYNMPQIMRLTGNVDAAKLEKTFRELIQRHESLRTSFESVNNRLVQRVHETVEFRIDHYEAGRSTVEVGGFERPFELDRPPLFRAALAGTAAGKFIMMLDMHHIVADGISQEILTREFQTLYRGDQLPALPLQYRDFSLWQARLLESGEPEEAKKYRLTFFPGKLPRLDLPTDFPRPGNLRLEGESFGFRSGKKLARKLNLLCRETGCTLYMVLLAAFNVLLYCWSGCTDILVGSPASGRNHPDLENIVGPVMGTLVLRNYPEKNKTFSGFLEEVKKNTLEAYRHQAYPFEELLEKSGHRRDRSPGRNPLFDVGLIVQNKVNDDPGKLIVTPYTYEYQRTSKLDLTLTALEESRDISFHLEYSTALFKHGTMERFSVHFLNVLKEIVEMPGKRLEDFTLKGHPGTTRSFSCYIVGESALPVRCGEILLRCGHRVLGVVSPNPRVTDWCREKNIPFIPSLDSAAPSFLNREPFDYLFSINNGYILPPDILALPRKRAVNFHDSPLPRYAGMYAPGWALMNRETRHAVTWHDMDNGIDTGDILEQKFVDIGPGETAGSLNMKCFEAAVESFEILVPRLETGDISPRPQDPAQRTYYPYYKRPFAAGFIFFDRGAEACDALVRALDFGNYPNPLGVPKIVIGNEFFIVTGVFVTPSPSTAAPGTVTRIAPDSLTVATGSDDLEIREILTLEGRRVEVGEPVARWGVEPGKPLNVINAESAHRIDRVNRGVCRHEASWVKRLRHLRPVTLPYTSRHDGETSIGTDSQGTCAVTFAIPRETGGADGLVTAFLAGLCRIMHRYTYDTGFCDPALRSYVHGLERLFTVPVPLRVDVDPGATFGQCDRTLREELTRVRKRKTFTRDLLYRYRSSMPPTVSRDLERTLSAGVFIVEDLESALPVSVPNFYFVVPERGDRCLCLYNNARLKEEDIRRLLHHFTVFLKGTVSHPSLPLRELPLLDEEDRYFQLHHLNDTHTGFPRDRTVHRMFEEQAERTPGNVAVSGALTYGELNRKSGELARELRQKGVCPGAVVGIMVERSPLMLVGLLAVLKAGGAYLPIEPGYPRERIDHMLADSGTRILLRGPNDIFVTDAKDVGNRLACSSTPTAAGALGPAYILYTSGSTGTPKGVVVTHRNLSAYIHAFNREFHLRETDIVLQQASYCFDAFAEEVYPVLLKGGALVIARREDVRDIHRLARLIETHRVSVISCSPHLLSGLNRICASGANNPLGSVHTFISGGDVLEPEHIDHLLHTASVYNTYGPTETTVCATFYRCRRHRGPGVPGVPIGAPIANYRIYLLDEERRLVPPGLTAEICIAGEGVAAGYLNNPELTAEKFYSNKKFFEGSRGAVFQKSPPGRRRHNSILYFSGDLGRWLPGGILEFAGRKDHQVKIRGYRVEPSEIENQLLKHGDIRAAVVVSRRDRNGDNYLCAYLVCRSPHPPPPAELREYLSSFLPEYMVPSRFVPLDELPLTGSGKVDRNALPDPSDPGWVPVETVVPLPPRSGVEKKLVEIWAGVLGIEENGFGVTSNFFEMGGHSLNAAVMISEIHKVFHVKLPLGDVFKHPCIEALAGVIDRGGKNRYRGIETETAGERKTYYPLSAAQKRLFFLDRLENVGTAYNMPFMFVVRGDFDSARFEKTFKRLIQRHESLRTSFHLVDGVPIQKIHDRVEFKVEYFQLAAKSREETRMDFIRPFDLSRAPLLRVSVGVPEERRRLVLVDLHHIAADGTSMGILVREFARLYNDDGQVLPGLRIQYKEFALWQDRLHQSGEIREQEEYWLRRFGNPADIPLLNLPTDYPRPENFSFEGDFYEFNAGAGETARFKALAAASGATFYMNLAAVFTLLLHKYSGQEDIIAGTGIAGRRHADLQNIVGMFVNTLAVRTHPRGEKTYARYLREVKAVVVEAFENQDLQLEDLVDRLNLERDPSRNPLFDVSLVLQNFDQPTLELRGLEVEPYRFQNRTSKFDLTLYAFETAEGVDFQLEYCTALFKPRTVRQMAGHLLALFHRVTETPDAPISHIDMVTDAEKERLLYVFNDTAAPFPAGKTVHRIFEDRVEKAPDRVALIGPIGHISPIGPILYGALGYRALDKQSNRLAHYLFSEKRIRPGERVAVLMDRSIDLVIALLGVLKAGGVYMPLDPALPEERMRTVIHDAGPGVLLSQKRFIRALHRLQWECPSLHTFLCTDTPDIDAEEETEKSGLMDSALWDYTVENAENDITAGGWRSSYTGEPFSREEMDEYARNTLEKLRPLLHKESRVLEIGCSSGITMYRIAPKVGFYYGTDISGAVIRWNRKRVRREGYHNIKLSRLAAHGIGELREKDFDLVIMNSVIQAFHGHNYLRRVISACLDLLKPRGNIFIGDVMNQDLKAELIRDLEVFRQDTAGKEQGARTKTDLSAELFVSPGYFDDLAVEFPGIVDVLCTRKIHGEKYRNELTRFRFDALLAVDKNRREAPVPRQRKKYRHDASTLAAFSTERPVSSVTSRDPAYLIYTSGTSGNPKGVLIGHRGPVNLNGFLKTGIGIGEGDRVLQFANIAFDASIWDIFGALLNGAVLHVVSSRVIEDYSVFEDYLEANRITVVTLPPPYLARLNPARLTGLRVLISAGSEIDWPSADRWRDRVRLFNAYGPTESTICAAAWEVPPGKPETVPYPTVPIGRPLPNTRVTILDKYGCLLPVGIPGELCIAGQGLARGYLNDPELTAARFSRGAAPSNLLTPYPLPPILTPFYRTGDLARWSPEGLIEFLGRIDEQVKIRGFRIEPREIEKHLLRHDHIHEATVMAGADQQGEKYLCAYFVAHRPLDTAALREFLAGRLPGYMIPDYFLQVAHIPLTANGKIDKKSLPPPERGKPTEGQPEPIHDFVERKVVEIWAGVLGVDAGRIGRDTGFFDLGGHSLNAISVVSRIHKELNVKIPLAAVFKHRTAAGLARLIRDSGNVPFASIRPVPKKEYYLVSHAQKRLYLVQQFIGGGTVYNMPTMVTLDGNLNKKKLEHALKQLIERHESLRTSFHIIAGEPVQRIHSMVDFEMEYFYLAAKTREETRSFINDFIRSFDLSRAPLLRAALIETGEKKYILAIDIHHIVSDGVSQGILIREFIALYRGDTLPPLQQQYKDYAQWRHETGCRGNYWMEIFQDEVPVLNLPLDFLRPPVQAFEGETAGFTLERPIVQALNERASSAGATLFMVLSALYNVLLSLLSGQEDIVIGTAVDGRGHADLENIVGMFVNTLAMRNRPSGDKPFKAFLGEVKHHTLGAFENRDYPFESLVEQLASTGKVTRDTGRNPLCDVMFSMQNMDKPAAELPGLKIAPLPFESKTSRFDMTLLAADEDGRLFFTVEYCTALFKPGTIERFIVYFRNVVSCVLLDPGILLKEIECLPPGEKQRLLVDFNDTGTGFPREKSIDRLFEEQAAKTPDHTALIGPMGALSYSALDKKSGRLARQLQQKGLGPGTIAAVEMERSIEVIIVLLAILKAGGAYLPIDSGYPRERIDYMLADSEAKILLRGINDIIGTNAKDVGNRLACSSTSTAAGASNPAYIIYTSGTTGTPKGVMIEHRHVVRLLKNDRFPFDFGTGDVWTLFHSFCFDFSVWEMYGALLYGGTLVIISKTVARDPGAFFNVLRRERVTVLNQTPSAFYNLMAAALENTREGLYLRYIIFGGEVLDPGRLKPWKRRYPEVKLMNMYGITETTVFVTRKEIGEEEILAGPGNIGKPLPTLTVYVFDNYRRLVPIGVSGELWVGGIGVGRGYLNRPELTAERFNRSNKTYKTHILYKSGDRVRFSHEGELEFLGRIDRQVKIRGFRVELPEIETRLLKHKNVKEAVVTAGTDGSGNTYLCAYIVCHPSPSNPDFKRYLSRSLPGYMVPAFFVILEKIPLTPNGKVDIAALPRPGAGTGDNRSLPRDIVEEKLAEVWAELLHIDKSGIGTHDNFFDLGGHSLTAALLSARVHRELNVKVPLVEIFKNPSIEELAEYIRRSGEDPFVFIPPAPEKEYYAVSPMQKRLFILHQLEGIHTAYNLPHVLEIEGNLKKEKLKNAFLVLIERHQSLRTSFILVDGQPVQKIHRNVEFKIEYHNGAINDPLLLIPGFFRPFDLSRPPLLRAGVIRVGEQRYILMLDMHHIIADGTSVGILVKDVMAFYRGEKPAAPYIQYKDFTEWLQSPAGRDAMDKQETFWLETFKEKIPRLDLPTDFPRPPVQGFKGGTVHFALGPGVRDNIHRLVKDTGTTLYMVMLAVLNVLLFRYTGETDILIGTPVAGRDHVDFQRIIGLFMNVLVMRNFPREDITFEEFLNEVGENALAAFKNQGYPYDRLLEVLKVEKDFSRNPLFDVELAVQNMESPVLEIEGLRVSPYDFDAGVTQVDLGFYVSETEQGIHINLVYCTDLFKRETMERLALFFQEVVIAVTDNPGAALGDIFISHHLQPAGPGEFRDDEADFGF